MTSVENLSDVEIRLKLAELGYPVGPITATTRKTLVKKLKTLLDQAGPKSYKSLAKYSSEEESEDDNNTASRSRRSMPPPPPKSAQKTVKRKSVSRRSQDVESTNDFDDSSVSGFHPPTASSTHYSGVNLEAETSNLKYSPKNIVSPPPNNRPITPERKSVSSTFQSRFIKNTVKGPELFESGSDTDGLDELEGIGNKAIHSSPVRPTSTGLFSAFKPSFSPGLTQARSRFQPQSYGSSKQEAFSPRLSPKTGSNNDVNNHASPFSSDFARRLSVTSPFKQSPGIAASGGLSSRLLDVKESDDEEGNSRPSYTHQSSGNLRRGTSVLPEGKLWKNGSTISFVLLFIVAIFFCGLAVMYLNVRFKDTEISSADTNFPICKMGDKPGSTCLVTSEVQDSMEMFRQVYRVVLDRAVQAACGGADSAELTQDQLAQIIVERNHLSLWDVEKYFGNIRVLIKSNPQWGVRLDDNKYSVPEPSLPLSCVALNILYGIVGSVLRLFVVVAVGGSVAYAGYWWMERRERNRKDVFRLVESIIDILSSSSDQYTAISHVRDQLIPPQQRDKLAGLWVQAVAYLEENESRVRTEVQQVEGEEFRVWRWLAAPKANGKRRVWQGQAFETMEGSVNSLAISPTPCLKIRHMFDSDVCREDGEDWPVRVQDAILEKCESVNVLHIAVDRNSTEGCVYVKCATPTDAGRAYRALHGSWFDSKLVTVKYLRLERYHERFPDAARCTRPLRPSNEHKLSLQ